MRLYRNTRNSTQSKPVDGSKHPIVPNTKRIVVNVCALEFLERSRVAYVGRAEGGELRVLLGGDEEGRVMREPESVRKSSVEVKIK